MIEGKFVTTLTIISAFIRTGIKTNIDRTCNLSVFRTGIKTNIDRTCNLSVFRTGIKTKH